MQEKKSKPSLSGTGFLNLSTGFSLVFAQDKLRDQKSQGHVIKCVKLSLNFASFSIADVFLLLCKLEIHTFMGAVKKTLSFTTLYTYANHN